MKVSAIMHDSFDLTVFRSSFVVRSSVLASCRLRPPARLRRSAPRLLSLFLSPLSLSLARVLLSPLAQRPRSLPPLRALSSFSSKPPFRSEMAAHCPRKEPGSANPQPPPATARPKAPASRVFPFVKICEKKINLRVPWLPSAPTFANFA